MRTARIPLTVALFLPVLAFSAQSNQLGASPSSAAQRSSPAILLGPQGQAAPQAAQAAPASAQVSSQQVSGLSTVIVDPAHGGSDPGARGPTGISESDVVMDFARALRVALEGQHLRVLLTRDGNQDPSFDDRSAIANGLSGAIFISLHIASTGPVNTARAYYYDIPPAAFTAPPAVIPASPSGAPVPAQSPIAPASRVGLLRWDRAQANSAVQSRHLAELIQAQLTRRFKGSPDSPLSAPVRQLRTIAAPAVAVEASTVEVEDVRIIQQMAQPLAEALAQAIMDYLSARPGATTGVQH